MTERQLIAIENHCRFAFECAQPQFRYECARCSVVLTVNSGYE